MKYTFETDDELEARQIMAAKDAFYLISQIKEYLYNSDIPDKDRTAIFDMIDELPLDEIWR